MKKFISLIICAVLLIAAFISDVPNSAEIIAGRGKGVDSKVTNAQEFANVLNYFNEYKMKPVQDGIAKQENNFYSAETDEKEEKEEYTSATFYNKSKVYSEIYTTNNKGSVRQTTTFTRELTINFTETAAYYHSVGQIMEKQTIHRETTDRQEITEKESMTFDFDMDIYVTTQICYVKFNKFDRVGATEDDSIPNISVNMLNTWFSVEGEISEEMLSLNQENLDILGGIGDFFNEFEFSRFKQNNKKYVLEDKYIQEFFKILSWIFPKEVRGEFTVNLRDETQPKMRIIESYGLTGDSIATSYAENNIIFSYINNTVIDASRLPKDPPKIEDYLK